MSIDDTHKATATVNPLTELRNEVAAELRKALEQAKILPVTNRVQILKQIAESYAVMEIAITKRQTAWTKATKSR